MTRTGELERTQQQDQGINNNINNSSTTAMASNTNIGNNNLNNGISESSTTGTTGPIVVNPILDETSLSEQEKRIKGLLNGINNHGSSLVTSMDNLLLTDSNSSSTSTTGTSASGSHASTSTPSSQLMMTQMITNSLYRNKRSNNNPRGTHLPSSSFKHNHQMSHQDQIRRNLIQNPWESHQQQVFESINPRYSSRTDILAYNNRSRQQSHQSHLLNNSNSDHVYECIDPNDVNNFNEIYNSASNRRLFTGSSDPRILNV